MRKISTLKYFRGSWQPTKIKRTICLLQTNIHAFNFHGSSAPPKYFNNEHFPNYSIHNAAEGDKALIIDWRNYSRESYLFFDEQNRCPWPGMAYH